MGFPLVLANGPPADRLGDVAAAGVTMVRTGIADWSATDVDQQLAVERAQLDAAAAHGLQCWVWLGTLTNLPPGAPSPQERLLTQVVEALRTHPALGAWKGQDEPRNPFNSALSIPPANLARGHRAVNATRSRAPAGRGPGAARHRQGPDPVPPGVRHRRRRHLSRRVSARRPHRSEEQGHQRRRRRRPVDQAGGRHEAVLDDIADRLERRDPDHRRSRISCPASLRDPSCASWPTRRSRTAHAGSSSSADT